jgi:fatty acid-binding protein DegV
MITNQTGFAFPLSLCMLVLFSTFVIIGSQTYLNEKMLASETESILKQEYYFLHAVRKLESLYQSGEPIVTGELLYQDGRVSYTKEDIGTTLKVNLILTFNTGEQVKGYIYFDKNSKKVTKWVEIN